MPASAANFWETDDMSESAGQRLRADLDAALAAAGRESGRVLEFSEVELAFMGWAADAVDRAVELGEVYDAELAGDRRPSILVKLSGEIRACNRAAADLVSRVEFGVGKAKSPAHVRAGQARWRSSAPA